MQLVLSLFPGADLFGMAFEAEGFCVVRGPDALLGGDVRKFKCGDAKFDGVIGGPPCVTHTGMRHFNPNAKPDDKLCQEFDRIINEARPKWWVRENVPQAPPPAGAIWSATVDAWEFGAHQHRKRTFHSNLALDLRPIPEDRRHPDPWWCVLATEHRYSPQRQNRGIRQAQAGRKYNRRMTLTEVKEAMGVPIAFKTPALLMEYQYKVLGNGIPLPMGLAIARAVKAAIAAGKRGIS